MNQLLLHYSYLQVLDFLTTIAFLVNGVKEANPLVRLALNLGHNPIGSLIGESPRAVAGWAAGAGPDVVAPRRPYR